MKILVVSNLYPPYTIGGYEMRCSWVTEELRRRGHQVHVVCSSYGCNGLSVVPERINGVEIHRILHDYSYTHIAHTRFQRLLRLKRQCRDVVAFARTVDSIKPDIVNWWNLGGLCKGIIAIPSSRNIPDIHWIEDVWMKQLRTDSLGDSLGWEDFWSGRLFPKYIRLFFKPVMAMFRAYVRRRHIPITLNSIVSDFACFSCEFQRKANRDMRIQFRDSAVVFGVSKGENFFFKRDWSRVSNQQNPLRLLYISAMTESRQPHVLIEALEKMDNEQRRRFSLTIVGGAPVKKWEEYYKSLQKRVAESPLKNTVTFTGQLPYSELPVICSSHDVLVFTSARPEGTPNIIIESMLSGLCILSTGSGGAGEISSAARQPVFKVSNSEHLRDTLIELEQDRGKVISYARGAQETTLNNYSFSGMADKFEEILVKLGTKNTISETHSLSSLVPVLGETK